MDHDSQQPIWETITGEWSSEVEAEAGRSVEADALTRARGHQRIGSLLGSLSPEGTSSTAPTSFKDRQMEQLTFRCETATM
jgi:hypothetical protein